MIPTYNGLRFTTSMLHTLTFQSTLLGKNEMNARKKFSAVFYNIAMGRNIVAQSQLIQM